MPGPQPCPCGKCESYRDHVRSITISGSALPTRKKAIAGIAKKEATWDRDMGAYKRLREDGLQPPQIDGAGDLEAKAEVPEQVSTGKADVRPSAFSEFKDRFGHSVTESS